MSTPIEEGAAPAPAPASHDRRFTFLDPEAGPKVWMSGDSYRVVVDAAASAGTMTLLDAVVPPGGGPPMHAHEDVDELFYVVEGALEITADGVSRTVEPGGRVFVRRQVPHAFRNNTDRDARMLIFYTPAGIETFFLEAGRPAVEGEAPPPSDDETLAREIEIAARHRIAQASGGDATSASEPERTS